MQPARSEQPQLTPYWPASVTLAISPRSLAGRIKVGGFGVGGPWAFAVDAARQLTSSLATAVTFPFIGPAGAAGV